MLTERTKFTQQQKKLGTRVHLPGEEQIICGLREKLPRPGWTASNMLSHRECNQPMHRCPQDIDGPVQISPLHTTCLAPLLYGPPYDQKRSFGFLNLVNFPFQIKHQLIQGWMMPGKVPISSTNLEQASCRIALFCRDTF